MALTSTDLSLLFDDESLADCIVHFRVDDQILSSVHCHRAILCAASDYFSSIVHFNNESSSKHTRPEFFLDVSHDRFLDAAVAVVAAPYGRRSFLYLDEQRQMYAILFADKYGFTKVAREILCDASVLSTDKLHSDTIELLLGGPIPDVMMCVVPKIARALVDGDRSQDLLRVLETAFGDLEGVCQDPRIYACVMDLPQHAFRLLLSSDNVKAHSEDTVLYLVGEWISFHGRSCRDVFSAIRVQHLSHSSVRTAAAAICGGLLGLAGDDRPLRPVSDRPEIEPLAFRLRVNDVFLTWDRCTQHSIPSTYHHHGLVYKLCLRTRVQADGTETLDLGVAARSSKGRLGHRNVCARALVTIVIGDRCKHTTWDKGVSLFTPTWIQDYFDFGPLSCRQDLSQRMQSMGWKEGSLTRMLTQVFIDFFV